MTLTGLSCLLAVATVPLLTRVFERVIGRTLGFDVTPGLLLIQLAFMLAAPVGLGMWIRSRWPVFAAARLPWAQSPGAESRRPDHFPSDNAAKPLDANH